MDVRRRVLLCQMIEGIKGNEKFSDKIGVKDCSEFKGETKRNTYGNVFDFNPLI